MSTELSGGRTRGPQDAAEIKQCCARLYESEIVSRLLGESFHPGGAKLTERLGELLGLTSESRVLDAASGRGASALVLAQRFGCAVAGVDLSARNVEYASAEAERLSLADRVRFEVGDAEQLPVDVASVDAIICECAFCMFPDKPRAAQQFMRVLKPGGRVGLSDITRAAGPPGELADLMAWIACLADARPAVSYAAWLTDAGFTSVTVEPHDQVLLDMIRSIGGRLFATEVLAGLRAIDLTGIDLAEVKRLAEQALAAANQRRLGYATICATKP
jgi:ubiquinone/menaquinone biosynthesis C-methylase UbiE